MAWHHRGKGKCRRSCFDTFSRPVRHTLVQSIVDLLAELYHQVTTISWLTIRNMYTVFFRMALNIHIELQDFRSRYLLCLSPKAGPKSLNDRHRWRKWMTNTIFRKIQGSKCKGSKIQGSKFVTLALTILI